MQAFAFSIALTNSRALFTQSRLSEMNATRIPYTYSSIPYPRKNRTGTHY